MDFKAGPIYMGIINVTPDSFSDGGRFIERENAIAHGLELEREGAHILDIGGESTRPGADSISIDEELDRVIPVIKGLKEAGVQALLSVDTRNARVMEDAIKAGVDIINDVSALIHDPLSFNVAVESCLPVCLMHMQGDPKTMQNRPIYDDVIDEIYTFLATQVRRCLQAGMDKNKIICDPGIGFGKTLENNANIFKNFDKFHSLECPLMVGASRKSFINSICPNTPAENRLAGSIVANLEAYKQGVQVFRVHDVAQTKQAFEVYDRIST